MKTKSKSGQRQFLLEVTYGISHYIEQIAKLERILAKQPRTLQINLIGVGEIPADMALLIRSVLATRAAETRLITNARSSLQGGSVLVWLLGDTRIIRDDARILFRRTTLSEEEAKACHEAGAEEDARFCDSFSETDPEEIDYARVLELINEYLPVKELAGRRIEAPTLRQFGLVQNDRADDFLAHVFGRQQASAAPSHGQSGVKGEPKRAKSPGVKNNS